MIVKIYDFNFVSEDAEKIRIKNLSEEDRFQYFFMDGKEDTLYVGNMYYFDKEVEYNNSFEQELMKKYSIVDYKLLIYNQINSFIKEKTMRLYLDNNYSRYELYNNIREDYIEQLNNNKDYSVRYTEVITKDSKLVCDTDIGYKIIFNPYKQEIENLEEIYKQGYFNRIINNNLILLEIKHKKAPPFVTNIYNISNFLKDKQSINVVFRDNSKVKVNARFNNIFYLRNNVIELNIYNNENYGLKDMKALMYNRTELKIEPSDFENLKEQIIQTSADMISFKIDEMKEKLYYDFSKYCDKFTYYLPSTIENCIQYITSIDEENKQIELSNLTKEKRDYPEWYSSEFDILWNNYNMIKLLENATSIEDIKEVAKETGDNELMKIYYVLEGEEYDDMQEDEEEII